MTASRVVEAFDEVEHGQLGHGTIGELRAVEQLAFERGEEALAHGVVVAVADRSHGRPDSGFAAAPTKLGRGVLAALVRVVDDASSRPALFDGHGQRLENELRGHARAHGPADNLPAPDIEHDG